MPCHIAEILFGIRDLRIAVANEIEEYLIITTSNYVLALVLSMSFPALRAYYAEPSLSFNIYKFSDFVSLH